MSYAIYVTVLVVATCGLVYELVAGPPPRYVLGDSVTQFSTVIGVYLFALGVGSFLSRYVQRGLAARFVELELAVALVGGWSAPLLFLAFGQTPHLPGRPLRPRGRGRHAGRPRDPAAAAHPA